jgi:hypothetical protein
MPNTATKMVSKTIKIPRKSPKVSKMASLSISRFSADPPLSLAGGRRSAQALPASKILANWQTQFFFRTQLTASFVVMALNEFANRGKLVGKVAKSFWPCRLEDIMQSVSRRCHTPLGQRISTRSISGLLPSPKCNTRGGTKVTVYADRYRGQLYG